MRPEPLAVTPVPSLRKPEKLPRPSRRVRPR